MRVRSGRADPRVGASIAGPVLAYWLSRYGYAVTVVECAPTLRKTGGHPVDLFRPAMEISERMGVLGRIEELATGTNRLTATLRHSVEQRTANGDEWAEFGQHFLLRKVALGDCHRLYGSPCVHEHVCTRCRFHRVDPPISDASRG